VSQKWRLDRLLQRKAQEGVKIFVIVYRNIGAAVPIDSAYTKYSLLDLHPNVYVQRSPNQIRQQTFFWAHHEKILVVDHMIAFVGGIDLCFGRWDTPQHAVGDDKPSGFEEGSAKCDPNNFQLWPGKDYSNPRVQDFFNLDKPYEDMYDREKVPRMPWHDIHMQIVGQPARDLTRHFVQRWNYLLRQRTPSRPTPLLLPPPDFTNGELESLGIDGSCEIQILRSACSWSLGTQSLIECSIQNAYLKSIEMSEHLVYIENQFFITSTEFENTRIENKIGDALVERIVRAAKNDEDWRAIIILPLMPGFESAIDAQDGTSVRLIMNCQFRSISQGENSIFGRLRVLGIEPEDYIQFFGLRNWGKIGKGKLVTEQLYIHAKCMVVDDRIAIIGSANINERSMLGNRDSEVAAIVRDTDTIVSTMAGQSYRVGRFPHTLRVRLMREHLGLDVDAIMQDELEEARGENGGENGDAGWEDQVKRWQDETAAAIIKDHTREAAAEEAQSPLRQRIDGEAIQRMEMLRSFNHDVDWEQQNNPNLRARQKGKADPRVTNNPDHQADVRGFGADHMIQRESERASLSVDRTPLSSPKLGEFSNKRNPSISLMKEEVKEMDTSASPSAGKAERSRPSSPIPEKVSSGNITPSCPTKRFDSIELGLPQLPQLPPLPITGDEEAGGPSAVPEIPDHKRTPSAPLPTLPSEFRCPEVAADMFSDPLNDSFYLDVWHKIAMNNTEIYRQVFRCQPDNEIKTWASYKEAMDYSERFSEAQERRAQSRAGKPEGHETTAVSNEKDAADYKEMPNGTTVEFTSTGIRLNLPDGDGTSLHSLNEKIGSNGSTRPRGNSYVSTRLNTATTATSTSTIQLSYSRGSQESKEKQPADPNLLQGTASVTYAHPNVSGTNTSANGLGYSNTRRRRRGTTRSSRTAAGNIMDLDLAEKMLGMVQGHLVIWPHDWLAKEQATGNWLYNIDQLAPIEI
jgi:phospholipase D1/2